MLHEADAIILLAYLVTGACAGMTGGLLGLGGGIIIVPALHYLFLLQGFPPSILMHMAVTTSLSAIVFTALASAWTHHRKGAVLWPVVAALTPGIVAGGVIGAWLANHLSSEYLRMGFGVFALCIALQTGLGIRPAATMSLPRRPGMIAAGGVIGTCSTVLGIGGGTLTIPALLWCSVGIRNAIAVSAACGIPIAIAGSVSMIAAGLDETASPENTIGYLYWPASAVIVITAVIFAPMGARLTHVLPISLIRKIFAVVLAIVGIRMLF